MNQEKKPASSQWGKLIKSALWPIFDSPYIVRIIILLPEVVLVLMFFSYHLGRVETQLQVTRLLAFFYIIQAVLSRMLRATEDETIDERDDHAFMWYFGIVKAEAVVLGIIFGLLLTFVYPLAVAPIPQ